MAQAKKRDTWGSRLGIIMAVAGSAVGLGSNLSAYRILLHKSF